MSGGVLACFGVPEGVTVTLDHHCFELGGGGAEPSAAAAAASAAAAPSSASASSSTASATWAGAREVPPGAHFCATALKGGFPTGFFFFVGDGEVALRRWSKEEECLLPVGDDEEGAAQMRAQARGPEMLARMLRYDARAWGAAWRSLSAHITPRTVARLSPVNDRCISVLGEPDGVEAGARLTEGEKRLDAQLRRDDDNDNDDDDVAMGEEGEEGEGSRGGGQGGPGGAGERAAAKCFYARIPRKVDRAAGVTGRDLTALYLDKTATLEQVVARACGGDAWELLGEMQFAFVAFMMCQSLAGFNQWKAVVALVLQCERGPLGHLADFTCALLRALRAQLAVAEHGGAGEAGGGPGVAGSLVADIFGPDVFLRSAFRGFVATVAEAEVVPVALEEEVAALREVLRAGGVAGMGAAPPPAPEMVGTDAFDGFDEDDEYAPTVVHL